jgi:hypothetical protein
MSGSDPQPPDLDAVVGAQRPSGAFGSTIVRLNTPVEGIDENAFVTVQVLRALAGEDAPIWRASADRAISFLERCEIAPDAYGFWPLDAWPAWMPRFGPDVDDTALIAGVLVELGRLQPDQLLRVAATLSSARVRQVERLRPGWINCGAFGTWVDGPPIVDCAINANVAGFLAGVGWHGQFGYRDAVRTVVDGIAWAAESEARLGTLAPFYPHPGELRIAITSAIHRGAVELEGALAILDERFGPALGVDETTPVCGSAYGAACWYAPVLAAARGLSQQVARPPETPAG